MSSFDFSREITRFDMSVSTETNPDVSIAKLYLTTSANAGGTEFCWADFEDAMEVNDQRRECAFSENNRFSSENLKARSSSRIASFRKDEVCGTTIIAVQTNVSVSHRCTMVRQASTPKPACCPRPVSTLTGLINTNNCPVISRG